MPKAPNKPCRASNCRNYQIAKGFCEEHQQMAVGFFRTSTKSRHERGYGYEWEKRRAVKLKLKPLCEYCEEKGRITIATEVDHVIPKSKGGTDEPSNLKSCCRACNLSKTVKDKR